MNPDEISPEKFDGPTGDEPDQQQLYAGRFYRQTGKLPVGDVEMKMAIVSRKHMDAGLQAQVRVKGVDGTEILKTIFTPIKRYLRDGNKFLPADEDIKHEQERTSSQGAPGETEE